jgi:NAD(P)H-flavin reductase
MNAELLFERPEPICGMDTWLPVPAKIASVKTENSNTFTFGLRLADEELASRYRFAPGQFNMLYVPGVGEAAISISSDAEGPRNLVHTIRVVGSVTRAIHNLGEGATLGLRGPFGRGWPLDALEGRDVVLVAGGIGLAPLRPVIYWILNHRERYRRVILLYGSRSPEDCLYQDELEQWTEDPRIDILITVDNATGDWVGPVGVVTNLLRRIKVDASNSAVYVCGPRILNRVAAWQFLQLHVPRDRVFVSLERNMNCGFGRCGHCQYGSKFVCKDGPVFPFSEVAHIFGKEEV